MDSESEPVDPAIDASALWRAQLNSGWAWLEVWLQFLHSIGGKPPPEVREAALDKMTKEPLGPV
jgi:hypothetical protein